MSNNICNIIQIEIRSKNFTLEHIASQMGSTRSSIYKMIRNPNISAVNLQKLSQILGYNFFNHFYIDSNHPTTDQWHEERRQNRHLNCELKKTHRAKPNPHRSKRIPHITTLQNLKPPSNPTATRLNAVNETFFDFLFLT